MKLLIVGGVLKEGGDEERCARALGSAVASKGHTLLNGCYNAFDRIVAEAAMEAAQANPVFEEPKMAVHSFVAGGSNPAHKIGLVRKLRISNWDPGQKGWKIPEPIDECEALICMGGGPGSHRALHLCRLAKKPILPITAFGGAAEEAFATELDRFDDVYRGRVPKESYTVLDTQYPEDMGELASAAVELASRIVSGNAVFIVMPFKSATDDTFNTVCRVVEDFDFVWDRTDKDPTTARIYNRIVEGIQRAALVVADVTHESLNVYYELGFAEALDKPVIVIAKEGIELPFDTKDIPTILYPDQTRLEEKLRGRIQGLTGRHSSSGK